MIILASSSWLRKTIMDKSGLTYSVDVANLDERVLEQKHPLCSHTELAMLMATSKAKSVVKRHPNDLIVAADTFAILPSGERLHKPGTFKDGITLCMKQSGKKIWVVTGLAMIYKNTLLNDASETYIKYLNFSKTEVKRLLEANDPTVRNAGLGFFLDAPGFTLVSSFSGSYTGAMGLPMEILKNNLIKLKYKDY